MQVNLTDKEVGVILSALAGKKEFYESIRENPNGITKEAAEEALEVVGSVEEKLNSRVARSEAKDLSEPEKSSEPGEPSEPSRFLYLYLPDGIRDRSLEEELSSRIPETDNPEPDNFFWSNKFDNFVVKADFEAEVREAIRERYDGDVILKENPGWAKKPNTWQVIRKEDIDESDSQGEGQEAVPKVS